MPIVCQLVTAKIPFDQWNVTIVLEHSEVGGGVDEARCNCLEVLPFGHCCLVTSGCKAQVFALVLQFVQQLLIHAWRPT